MESVASSPSLEIQLPRPLEARPLTGLLRALAGYTVLGLAASSGAAEGIIVLKASPVVLGIALLPLLLTAPALLVVHQFFGFKASPKAVIASLGSGAGEAGRLALGLAPIVLFLSLGSMPWGVVLGVSLCWAILRGLRATVGALRRAEELASVLPVEAPDPQKMARPASGITPLGLAWWLLVALMSLRLAILLVPYLCV